MKKWIDPKKQLPPEDTEVLVQTGLFFKTRKYALFVESRFIHKGQDITRWVTHWIKAKVPNSILGI